MKKNSLFLKLFARAAKDASPEELETMAADAAAAMDEGITPQTPPATPAAKEESPKEGAQDSTSLDAKLDMLLDIMKGLAGAKQEGEPEKSAEDPLDSLVTKLTGEAGELSEPGTEAKVIPAEENDKATCAADKVAVAAVVRQLRPVIVGIKDVETKKAVTDSLVACLTDKNTISDIAKITQTVQKNAAKLTDQNARDDLETYQAAYDAMNPHKQNGGKKG